MAKAKKELKPSAPLSKQALLMQQCQKHGLALETATSAMTKWRYIDFVNPKAKLPCLALEWLIGARGFLAGRILQLRATFSKGKSSFMYLEYAMAQLMSQAYCMHIETEGAQAPADYIRSFGCDPGALMIKECQSLEECLAVVDEYICIIRGGFGGSVSKEGRVIKSRYDDPVDKAMAAPILVGIDSLSSLGTEAGVGVDIADAGSTAQLSYHTRKLREYFRNRVGRLRDTQTFMMLTSHETAKIETGKKSFGAPPGGNKTSLAQEAIGIHATYGMDVQASPYVDKARGVRLGDIVTMKTFKNKISPKDRMLNLYLEWNQGFDLVKTDFEFLLTHQASPFAVASETEKRRLYRHDGGVVCKELSSKKFGSEEEFLRAFYSNTDFCMSMREKLRIRGCGFQFENMFAALPDGELPEAKPGAADGLSGVLGVPAGSDIDPESPEAIDGALSENEAAAAEADEESGDAGGFANG